MSEKRRELAEQLMILETLLRRYQMQNFHNRGPFGNPQRGQGRVLSILSLKPEMSQKELTYMLGMSKQALAELLGKLEKSGYIRREPSQKDRRQSNVILTEEGAKIAGEIDKSPHALKDILEVIEDNELDDFGEYLERIITQLEEQFPHDDEKYQKHRKMMKMFMRQHGHHRHGRGHHHEHPGHSHTHRQGHPHGGHPHGKGPDFGRRGFPGYPQDGKDFPNFDGDCQNPDHKDTDEK